MRTKQAVEYHIVFHPIRRTDTEPGGEPRSLGGARLPKGLTIEPEQLMMLARQMLLRLKPRRAVIQRWVTARRVLRSSEHDSAVEHLRLW